MKYQCPSCKNRFSFRDKISFCPYCGANLVSADIGAVVGQDSPLAESMESFFSKKDEKIADIEKTSVCPLAKVMRKELKSRGISGVKVVFSTEPYTKPYPDGENAGVIPSMIFVPAAAGLMLACEVVSYLCGKA